MAEWAESKASEVTLEVEEPLSPYSRSKQKMVAFDVDFLQAALYYATTAERTKVLLFDTLFSRSSSSRGGGDTTTKRWSLGDFYARHRMLACFSLLVILQICLMHQLLFSVEHRACSSSSTCPRGTSCSAVRRRRREANVCQACAKLDGRNETRRVQRQCFEIFDSADLLEKYDSNLVPSPEVSYKKIQWSNFLHQGDVSYTPSVFVEVCSGCVDGDGTYKPLRSIVRTNVRAMGRGDFVTLLVCAIAVGLTIVGELREIKVSNIAQRRCFERTRARAVGHVWFAALNAVRAYVLVPQVIAAVPRLVLLEGGNTVSLIFNTVSVIFITELDNLLTQRILSPSTIHSMNERARVRASREDLRYLAVTQKSFVLGVIVVVFVGIFLEVKYFSGVAYLLAVMLVFVEGIAELVVYDSEQPLLTRVILTTMTKSISSSQQERDCCVSWATTTTTKTTTRRKNFERTATQQQQLEEEEEEEDDDDEDQEEQQPPTDTDEEGPSSATDCQRAWCCAHLRTVATQRRRRERVVTLPLLQDILAFIAEFSVLSITVIAILNSALRVWSTDF